MRKFFLLVAAGGLLAAATVGLASASRSAPKVTPSAETANAYLMPGDHPCTNDWMSFGCDVGGTAYSHLTQINKSNVTQLKVAWAAGYSPGTYSGPVHAQPLCCANNMMYLPSANTTEALEPDTGKIIWKYQGPKYDTTSGGPNSTSLQIISRNIAFNPLLNIIYSGQQDSSLVALNAKTGAPIWSTQVTGAGTGTYGTSTKSQTEPFALYVNDGKDGVVLSAPNGGESPMRGSLSAFDARNGKLLWRTYMTPDATQLPYILTWANPAEAAVGGAPIWSIPTYDIKDRLVIQGTGNTYPYLGRQPGKNLWANSFVAVHVDTGKLAWFVQPIHHDEWDYDCPHSPTVFNAIVHGKLTPVVSSACKNAYVYFMNPKNGHCIFGCPEVKNSTLPGYTKEGEALNNTYPTQMRPVGAQGQLIEHCPSEAFVKEQFSFYPIGPDGHPMVRSCDMVGPNASNWIVVPYYLSNGVGIQSRATYDPQTNMQYFCATNSLMIEENNSPTDYHTTLINSGRVNYVGRTGTITAINLNDNTIAWQHWFTAEHDGNCYSGTLSTASGLLFLATKGQTSGAGNARQPDYTTLRGQGVNAGGQLKAYDARTGDLLWEFRNPYADLIEGPPMTYMYKGKQYIAEEMTCPVGTGSQGPFQLCDSRDRLVVLSL
jgi:quinohemoprotein ethanol dehydrogenase